jgi:hypothetical protein
MKRRNFLQSLFSLPLIGAVREAPALTLPVAEQAPSGQPTVGVDLATTPSSSGYWVGQGRPLPLTNRQKRGKVRPE